MIQRITSALLIGLSLASSGLAQSSQSYIVLERFSRKVLLASNSEVQRPIAGLSNMAAAKVALDWASVSGVSSTTMLPVPNHPFVRPDENPLNLQAGDQISMRDALYATILGQDSVAAATLATYVGRDLQQRMQSGGNPQAAFIQEMNSLCRSSGMRSTRFINTASTDSFQKNNVSTAADIARLSVVLAGDPAYGFYAKQLKRTISVVKGDGSVAQFAITNSNTLLNSMMKVGGLKVASSAAAGRCASLLVDKNSYVAKLPTGTEQITPVQMVVVTLGVQNVEGLAQNLIPQGWAQYEQWRNAGYVTSPDQRELLKMH